LKKKPNTGSQVGHTKKIFFKVYSSFVRYSYQSGYYSYFIKFGLGLGEDACIAALALFYLCLLGCQSLRETLLQKYYLIMNTKA